MEARVEYITPGKAEEMLRHNDHNRKINQAQVDRFTEVMKRGAWLDNGASIVMNGSMLLDGQHRLLALIKSGEPQHLVVVRDVDPSAFATIDTGTIRKLKDVLSIKGEAEAKHMSVALNHHRSYTASGSLRETTARDKITFQEMLDYASDHPSIRKSLDFVLGFKEKPLVSIGMAAALHALFREKDSLLADSFMRRFITGVGLVEDDPIKVVRDRLIAENASKVGSTRRRLTPVMRGIALVKAWNACRSGTPLHKIYIHKKGSNKLQKVEIK